MISEIFVSGTPYFDAVNFPHGFHRGGEFNNKESEILTRCGQKIKMLMAGDIDASNIEFENMLLVIKGEIPAESPVEKAWLKYLSVVNKRRQVKHISLGSTVPLANFEQDDFANVV